MVLHRKRTGWWAAGKRYHYETVLVTSMLQWIIIPLLISGAISEKLL
jgi:hypothetical protein